MARRKPAPSPPPTTSGLKRGASFPAFDLDSLEEALSGLDGVDEGDESEETDDEADLAAPDADLGPDADPQDVRDAAVAARAEASKQREDSDGEAPEERAVCSFVETTAALITAAADQAGFGGWDPETHGNAMVWEWTPFDGRTRVTVVEVDDAFETAQVSCGLAGDVPRDVAIVRDIQASPVAAALAVARHVVQCNFGVGPALVFQPLVSQARQPHAD